MTGNLILLGLAVFVTIMGLVGYKVGLSKMIMSVTFGLIVIILVNLLLPLTVSRVNKSSIQKKVYERVDTIVLTAIDANNEDVLKTSDTGKKKIVASLPLPKSIKDDINKNCNDLGFQKYEVKSFKDYLVKYITDLVIKAITYCLLFLGISILLAMLGHIVGLAKGFTVVYMFDSFLGAAVGIFGAVLMIWILSILLTAVGTHGLGLDLMKAVSSNKILSWIFDNNPLMQLINIVA